MHRRPPANHWGERAWVAAWSELEEDLNPPEDKIIKRTRAPRAKSLQHEGEAFYFVSVGFFWSYNLTKVKTESHIIHVFCISPHIILSNNYPYISFNYPGCIWFPHTDFFPCPTHKILFYCSQLLLNFFSSQILHSLATLLNEHNNKPLPLDPIWNLDS